ncbi:MAG: molybdenum cofactor biosynthesis protein MoaE [Chthoniobacterales bacterium]
MDFYHIEIKTGPLTPFLIPNPGINGAEVSFHGIVRADEKGETILGITYEAHPRLAEPLLRRVAETAAQKYPISALYLLHGIGFIAAGEISLILQVQSPHRKAAFDASAWIIEELKHSVPIWKRPIAQGMLIS